MNAFSNEINKLAAELCSQKVNTRNKAAELLDQKLTHSKADLCDLLESGGGSASERLTWSLLFENAVDAAINHADMLFESREKKGFQTMVNKNHIYSSIITKLTEYNLEAGCQYLAKATIIKAFCVGISKESSKYFFGLTFLQLLDRGIFSAPTYVRDLKINEYSRILSYLFEVDVFGDNQLFSGILKTLTRTIELAVEHVQIQSDILDYLPKLLDFCKLANNEQRKADLVKLYELFVNELSLDYRAAICVEVQKLLPSICGFYDEMNMKAATKVIFFKSLYISLHTIYPSVKLGNFGTMQVALQEGWTKTIKMVKTIVEMEIRYYVTFRLTQSTLSCSEEFVKLAALVTFITDWQLNDAEQSRSMADDGGETPHKLSRRPDGVERIIELVQVKRSTFNEVWLAVFVELISAYRPVLNMCNFQQVLDMNYNILRTSRNASHMRAVRLGLTTLLHSEARVFGLPPKSNEALMNLWSKVIDFLLSDTTSVAEMIEERELILQLMIGHDKMTPNQCGTLLNSIMANSLCKRNECIATIRELLVHAERCGIDKSSVALARTISWAYATTEKANVTKVLHNIAPINIAQLADTFAIAVINFLDKRNAPQSACPQIAADYHTKDATSDDRLQLLTYKYNQKLLCLAEYDKQFVEQRAAMALTSHTVSVDDSQGSRNCLFQINYELLMREVNYTITQGCQRNDILVDLNALHNITCLMERFLHYDVFDGNSFRQCALIKRIGLFLSRLEFQLKSNNPADFDAVDLTEMLTQLELIFTVYTSNEILLQFIELQPLEELISFVATVLGLSEKRQKQSGEFHDWAQVTRICLRILTILCGSSSHCAEAFSHIDRQQLKINATDTLQIISIFCKNNNVQLNIAEWLVDKLKNIFKFHHTDIAIVDKIVDLLPAIFGYIHKFDEQQQVMLIALNSLLKIAFKKSYPVELTVKILHSIAAICRRVRDIYVEQNFASICYSASKFFKFSSLKIQYATISMLIALMNTNLIASNPVKGSETHVSFCEQLYEHTDWQNFETSSVDQQQNCVSCVLQLLVSVFVFSSYQQEIALQDLVQFCALRKLNEDNFHALHDTVKYYKLTVKELAHFHVENVLMDWFARGLPIADFPHFVFVQSSKANFLKKNAAVITAFLLLHNKADEIKQLDMQAVGKNALEQEDTLSIISAFLLVSESGCAQAQLEDYKKHMAGLRKGLRTHGMDAATVLRKAMASQNAMTITTIAQLLRDPAAFRECFGFVLQQTPRRWHQLDAHAVLKCLHYYLCGGKKLLNDDDDDVDERALGVKLASELIMKQPLRLVELLTHLKAPCYDCAFTIDKLKSLCRYCTLAALLVDALNGAELDKAEAVNCYKFFVSDTICFMLDLLKTTHVTEVQQMALTFLKQEMLDKPGMRTQLGTAVLTRYLNDICKALVHCAQIANVADVRQYAIVIISDLLTERQQRLGDAFDLLDEFPATDEAFAQLRQLMCERRPTDRSHSDNQAAAFLAKQQHSVGSIRALQQNIAKNKASMLQADDATRFELIKCLIAIVRGSSKDAHERSFDALKCLGEIGPMKFTSISYYFQSDFVLTEAQAMVTQPMEQFVGAMFHILDKHLLHFNTKSHKFLIAVAERVVNWPKCESFIATFPNLQVFRANSASSSSLAAYASLKRIDWLKALTETMQIDNYDSWICAFMSRIFESCGWRAFAQFAAEQSSFADECLQPFVKLALADRARQLNSLCTMIDYFFDRFAATTTTTTSDTTQSASNHIFKEKRAVAKFLSICECVRIINDWLVPLKLLNIIKASRYCQAYFMSVMYLELWANSERSASDNFTFANILNDADFQENAKEAYKAIGCIDAMSGFLNPLKSRMDYLNMENNWADVLLEANGMDNVCTEVLKRHGMLHLANVQQKDAELVDYEIYWQLGQWDMPVDGHSKLNTLNDMEHEFKKHHYMALKSIYNREEQNSLSGLLNARRCVLVILREISVECLQSVYKYITWLKMLQQAEDFCKIQFATTTTANPAIIFEKWQTELEFEYGNFQCKDYLRSHQVALFKAGGVRANRKINDFYKMDPTEGYLLNMLKDCKAAGEFNLAKRNIAIIRAMPQVTIQTKVNVLLEDADVSLISGKSEMAKAILQHISTDETYKYCPQRVTALRMEGEQLMESNAQNFETVLSKYFNASLELLQNFEKGKAALMHKHPHYFDWHTFDAFKKTNRKSAYETIAKYANREYEQLNNYLNSEEYETRLNIIKENRLAADSLGRTTDRDKNVGATSMKRFANLDEKELQPLEDKRTHYLCIAIESYISVCRLDESCSSDAVIYRIIALWLANKHNQVLHTKIETLLPTVPSYKFICGLNQLTARLNSKNHDFRRVLTELLVRCVQEHPQHTLYQLYPLIYASHDSATIAERDNERVRVAKSIIERGSTKTNQKCVQQLDAIFPALIEYANQAYTTKHTSVADYRKTKIDLSAKLRNLQNLNAVHCPTLELNVSPNGHYDIISIIRWDEQATLVGGINVPKKLMCLCSDGRRRAQLLKGKDDLRQDAVMQQVFSLINNLLQSQPRTAEKKLQLRTYKIAPLSMRSGILEWCENTIPIGDYLTGDGRGGAHKKYRPDDYTSHKCRQLSLDHLRKSTTAKRYEVYKHICEKIQPVFHNFLLEKFLVPGVWFERRLAYTNSVAVTSIVGFVLGLGDRHTQNILIDEKTAEVIHIDFGIAFDQGKIMPTPETVPFRLTRDMVAPMGVCETNGVFRKSCEMTMSLLRKYQSVITTVLEVLLYDPLYIWNVVPRQEAIGDHKAADQTNLTAKRALIAVQSKLNGQEPGMLGFSTVEVQIQRLINEATSARNLCLLYPGWDPYL